MGSTDEPNRFQHTRVLGVDDVVANTGEGGVAAIGRTAGWGCCGGDDGGYCFLFDALIGVESPGTSQPPCLTQIHASCAIDTPSGTLQIKK